MKQENLYTPNCVRTNSGNYIDPFNPDPSLINIVDIAHALSNCNRFGGHTEHPFSVAQHCLNISTFFDNPHDKLTALLHDASEAYLGDMPKPIKDRLPDYQLVEHNLMTVIAKKYGFLYPLPTKIHQADKDALELEWDMLVLKKLDIGNSSIKWHFIELYNLIRAQIPSLPEVTK
jgi:hypothetical protein